MNPTTPNNPQQPMPPQGQDNFTNSSTESTPPMQPVSGVETGQETTPVEPQAFNASATVPSQTNPTSMPDTGPTTTEELTQGRAEASYEPSDQTTAAQTEPVVPTNTPIDFSMTDHSEIGVTDTEASTPTQSPVSPPQPPSEQVPTTPPNTPLPASPIDPAEGAPNLNNDQRAVDEKIRQTAESPLNTGALTEKKGNWFTRLFGGK